MQNEIQIFVNEKFGKIRTIIKEGEPWFAATDVCGALEISNNRMAISRLDEDEKMTVSLTDSHSGRRGGAQSLVVVNESGLYTLVLSSRKPGAKQFKRWITHDVIPSIRKHGAYFTNTSLAQFLTDPTQAHLLVMEYVKEALENERLSAQLELVLPKAEYYDTFIDPKECTNIRTTAKELGIPERAFVKYLLRHRYLYRSPAGRLLPYVRYYNKGYFIIRDFHRRSGELDHYTLFTAAGKEHLLGKICEILEEVENG